MVDSKPNMAKTAVALSVWILFATCDETPLDCSYHIVDPKTPHSEGPPAGNPGGNAVVPPEAALEDVSIPDQVVGSGAPESCTPEAFIEAVEKGGTICFDCGPDTVVITLDLPAKIRNDATPADIIIDGGGKVVLSGGGATRILYMNTCDKNQKWTTSHCQNQDHPRLTVQNLTFIDGNSGFEPKPHGGGAIFVRGGRFKAVNCRFFHNVCESEGPDLGGGAIRVLSQYQDLPVYIVNCTFGGGKEFGNIGSNGGALSSIGVSWTIINCLFTHNRAVGNGGNPAKEGTPGGGSGGAIYNDGNKMTLSISGSKFEYNEINAYGAAIFFVTNNRTGNIRLENTIIRNNIDHEGHGWHTLPGIAMHADTQCDTVNCVLE